MAKAKPNTQPEAAALAQQESETDHIQVISALDDKTDGGSPVALSEYHSAHPDGWAYIAGKTPVYVGLTPRVNQLLREGVLIEVATEDGALPE